MEAIVDAEWIKSMRKPLDLRAASKLIGVHRNTLWGWEKGQRIPSASHIASLRTLRRCIDEFLLGKEVMS